MSSRVTVALCAAALALAAQAAAAKELVFGSWVSPQHGVNKSLEQFFKDVEAETKGSLTWKMLAGGQMVDSRSTLAGIKDKLIDAGIIIPVFTRRELRASNTLQDMANYGHDAVAVGGSATETVMLHCPECQKEYRDNNAVFLGGYQLTNYYLICASPITTIAAVKGKKVRAVGAQSRLARDMGAVPVSLPPDEGVQAMQRGALDCIIGAIAWLESFGYMDVAKSIVDYPLGNARALGLVVMNRSTWQSLSIDQRKAIMKHMGSATARAIINGYIKEDERLVAEAKKKGIQFTKGGADFDELMKRHLESEEKAIPAAMKQLGLADPEAIMRAHVALNPKWEKIAGEVGQDIDKYAAALNREIYDKIDVTKY